MDKRNKGYGYMDKFIVSLEAMIEGLEYAKDAAAPELAKAVERWVVAVERDAKANLNRPRWLLQKNISSKVKDYRQNHKVWAMTGFRFKVKSDKRDPGYYGKYHEAGWAPDRKKINVPDHFLREAKKKNRAQLEKEVHDALADVVRISERIIEARQRGG